MSSIFIPSGNKNLYIFKIAFSIVQKYRQIGVIKHRRSYGIPSDADSLRGCNLRYSYIYINSRILNPLACKRPHTHSTSSNGESVYIRLLRAYSIAFLEGAAAAEYKFKSSSGGRSFKQAVNTEISPLWHHRHTALVSSERELWRDPRFSSAAVSSSPRAIVQVQKSSRARLEAGRRLEHERAFNFIPCHCSDAAAVATVPNYKKKKEKKVIVDRGGVRLDARVRASVRGCVRSRSARKK
uniref:Uncharacterized protein n=1 Tax=Trichogramma kaykai TaxID=54128 RepID=A0ABD2XN00_9HYME